MNPARWQAVGELFEKAVSLPPEERTVCVERATAGDDELRREVLSLLASHKGAPGGFVQEKIRNAVVVFHEAKVSESHSMRVGPYRLVRELGHGGMGTVFLAERDDGQYVAQVAIKLVKPGMDTDFVLARFRRERQILARLQHPNIARLLDGGTTQGGLPYIVMEFVDGPRITRFAKEQKLDIAARLRLFLDVCAAVDYAHRHFVVHRDLKPGNILVDQSGVPKLLDFGICKLLASEPLPGMSGGDSAPGMMTPNYASPEQIRGEAVTLVSDVYSLGVVLYELLTELQPYWFVILNTKEMAKAISEYRAPLPSTTVQDKNLARQLRGDLDCIVMRTLEVNPQDRYESVALVSEDLRRHLAREPVRAHPQTVGYRVWKFLGRYPREIAALTTVIVALAVALGISLRESRVADDRLAQVRALANKLVFDVHDAVRDLPGATQARKEIIQIAIASLDQTAAAVKGDARAERELASAYRRLGDAQGNVTGANLGDHAGALASYHKALGLLENNARRKPSDHAVETERLVVYHRIGAIQFYTGKASDAIQTLQEGIRIGRPALDSEDNQLKAALADLYIESCEAKRNMGDSEGSLGDASEALRLFQQIEGSGRATAAMRQSLATAYAAVGMAEGQLGRRQDALGHFRGGAAQMEKLVASEPHNASFRRDLMLAYGHIGDISGNPNVENLGDRTGALQAYRRAAEIGKALYEADPANQQAGSDYGIVLSRVATLMDDNNLNDKAAAERESLRVLTETARVSPTDLSLQMYRAFGNELLGDTLSLKGDSADSEKAYSEAAAIAGAGRKSGRLAFVTIFILSNLKLAENSAARGRRGEALEFAHRAFEASTNLPRGSSSPFSSPRGLGAMGMTYAVLARGPARQPGDREQALSWLRKSLEGWRRVQTEPGFAEPHRREMREVEDALAHLEHR
jgi:tetratricopeptide (TPR) repeat protein